MFGLDNSASLNIKINGVKTAYSAGYDASQESQSMNPSLALMLNSGDQITIDPITSETLRGDGPAKLYNWLNVIPLMLLYWLLLRTIIMYYSFP